MLNIRDRSFDAKLFVDVIEILDNVYIAQKLIGRKPEYYLENAGQNHLGYIYRIVIYNRETNTGFSLFLYENQMTKAKGYFRFQFKDLDFDVRGNSKFLKSLGIEKWDTIKNGIRRGYAIHLTDLNQFPPLITRYGKYIL